MELISKQPLVIRVKNVDYEYVKPKYLMPVSEFRFIEAVVKGSQMTWNLSSEQVSYNQIKKSIKGWKNV